MTVRITSVQIEDGDVGTKREPRTGPRREYSIELNGVARRVGQFEDSPRGMFLAADGCKAQLRKMVVRGECSTTDADEAVWRAVADGTIAGDLPTPAPAPTKPRFTERRQRMAKAKAAKAKAAKRSR